MDALSLSKTFLKNTRMNLEKRLSVKLYPKYVYVDNTKVNLNSPFNDLFYILPFRHVFPYLKQCRRKQRMLRNVPSMLWKPLADLCLDFTANTVRDMPFNQMAFAMTCLHIHSCDLV